MPPVRTKEWPYLDVISESANNAVRLLLGWFALLTTAVPAGVAAAVVLDGRRVLHGHQALRGIPAHRQSGGRGRYRKSFRHYTEERLLLSILFYATASALFAGIFIVRYHLELILFVPFAAGMFTYYLQIGMRPNSPVQNPEKLYTERGFFAYLVVSFAIFVLLMFTQIPVLYDWFNVEQSKASPLWILGRSRVQ